MGSCIVTQNRIMQTGQAVTTRYKEPMESKKIPEEKAESEAGNGVVRIKLVITKQELEVILRKEGISVGDLATHVVKESSNEAVVIHAEDNRSFGRWKPVLDSIPELN